MKRTATTVGALLVLTASASVLSQQPTPSTDLRGRVVNALTREPIRGAIVTIKVPIAEGDYRTREVGFLTGADGRFQFAGIDLSSATIGATKAGWVRANETPNGDAIDREQTTTTPNDLELQLWPEARVEGRIVDRTGVPIPNLEVVITSAQSLPGSRTVSDDEGGFAIGGLRAGRYDIEGLVTDNPLVLIAGEVRTNLVVRREIELVIASPGTRPTIAPSGNPTIRGVVVDSAGRAVPRANLNLIGYVPPDRYSGSAGRADEEGRFELRMPPIGLAGGGDFIVQASRTQNGMFSMLSAAHLMMKDGVRPDGFVHLQSDRDVSNLVVTVADGGSVTGRVTDAAGDPMAAAVWAVSLFQPVAGRPLTQSVTTATTGRYRLTGLPAGSYQLFAEAVNVPADLHVFDSSGADRSVAFLRTYAGGRFQAVGATPVEVTSAFATSGIDFRLEPVPATSIVLDATPSEELEFLRVDFKDLDDSGTAWRQAPQVGLRSSHTMAVAGLPAGRYRFALSAQVRDDKTGGPVLPVWGSVEIATDGITPVQLTTALSSGSNLTGQLVFDGTSEVRPTYILLMPSGTGETPPSWRTPGSLTMGAAGEFFFSNLAPERYSLSARASGWLVRSATLDGRNARDGIDLTQPGGTGHLVLTLTDRGAILLGSVIGAAASSSRVVIFPVDPREWTRSDRVQVLTAADGRYLSTLLLPGDYLVAALSENDAADTPAVLPRVAGLATRVTVSEGERRVQNLVLR